MPHDPLVDTEQCQRDITRMSELGVNGIRVYHVDPSADHKGCMEAFAEAGIYLFVDLDTFETQIEQVRSSNTKPPQGRSPNSCTGSTSLERNPVHEVPGRSGRVPGIP